MLSRQFNIKVDYKGYLYLISEPIGGLFKAGVTCSDPIRRLTQIQIHCPYPLTLVGLKRVTNALLLEKIVHERLDEYRIRGEWFKLPDISTWERAVNEAIFHVTLNLNLQQFKKQLRKQTTQFRVAEGVLEQAGLPPYAAREKRQIKGIPLSKPIPRSPAPCSRRALDGITKETGATVF